MINDDKWTLHKKEKNRVSGVCLCVTDDAMNANLY
jgi:hypothetical protein